MSLSRAFTTRRLRLSNDLADDSNLPRRSNTTRGPLLRHKISAPIQLIHTTNMLSYNAPDLPRPSRSNSTTAKSDEDSDALTTAESTPPTSPDVAPGERSSSPEPNHLTSYFKTPGKTLVASEMGPPAIPKRSPSHTKKNSYEAIARSRSVSRMSRESDLSVSTRAGQTFSRPPSTSTRASSASHSSSPHSQKQATPPPPPPAATGLPKDAHPFGQELAQVTELAEEYSTNAGLATIDEEQQYLESRGLVKLSATDYLGAIQSLSAAFFAETKHAAAPAPLWI
ncbi:hypothetical protein TOPH_00177 [Tolypocladium ophioglossoides CBS 100239]|uniref:Uncharacterized protein n=1 Tax=Tolypocladium ophioglossoides (strain CBS 100239) TaxID=1163406 RepID=A0A0L0NN74_TOLOC|nr:hypothetical protein TOPH_00177 [Tolypocladium ophioglossoides CBS 100239]